VQCTRSEYRRLALMLVGAMTFGCSDRHTIAGPELENSAAPPQALLYEDAGIYVARGAIVRRTIVLDHDYTASATITKKDGGYLWIEQAGLLLYFPKGAVVEDLVVTATAYAGNRVVYDFQPHGTMFNTPIYVVQGMRYTELNTPRSAKNRPEVWGGYLPNGLSDVSSDGTGSFSEIFAGQYSGKGNDSYGYFATTHFSGYAMASGRAQPGNTSTQ
jgi:hypothetical protein